MIKAWLVKSEGRIGIIGYFANKRDAQNVAGDRHGLIPIKIYENEKEFHDELDAALAYDPSEKPSDNLLDIVV
jgi:hypothetical protein